ncbi:MAG: DUF3107 family protein [Bifidobacteriaceae bacterium]|jgi:hypothetical protein|nr:DUF3107 family protein [Bifidobacteriaceae bacterium]
MKVTIAIKDQDRIDLKTDLTSDELVSMFESAKKDGKLLRLMDADDGQIIFVQPDEIKFLIIDPKEAQPVGFVN